MSDYVLYVIVRTNLESMTPGKAQAHSGHAACAFMYSGYGHSFGIPGFSEWVASTKQGFGTQFNLKAENDQDILDLINNADLTFARDIIVDPTYPFEVSDEIYHLLRPSLKQDGVWNPKTKKWLCYREEWTAAYIFGKKDELKPLLKKFRRHP